MPNTHEDITDASFDLYTLMRAWREKHNLSQWEVVDILAQKIRDESANARWDRDEQKSAKEYVIPESLFELLQEHRRAEGDHLEYIAETFGRIEEAIKFVNEHASEGWRVMPVNWFMREDRRCLGVVMHRQVDAASQEGG